MVQLTVRDVDEPLVQALRQRAASNGRSAEAEHRQILRAALEPRGEAVAEFAQAAARLRTRLRHEGDSAAAVREGRDARP